MEGVLETVLGSIRFLRRNNGTMTTEEVELDTLQDAEVQDKQEKDTTAALLYCQTIQVSPMPTVLVIVHWKFSSLVQTELKYSEFVNNHLKITTSAQ